MEVSDDDDVSNDINQPSNSYSRIPIHVEVNFDYQLTRDRVMEDYSNISNHHNSG